MRSDPVHTGQVSHWYAVLPDPRPSLPGDRDADVCIVGAGLTGLWAAYYLKRADPSLRIIVLEARFAGFGASGRNGGWLSALVPGDRSRMAEAHGRTGVVAWQRALIESVDEVIDVAAREGIDADVVKGGSLRVARTPAQHARLVAEVAEDRRWDVDVEVLTADEATPRIRIAGMVSASFTPHCARIQPATLVRGLADAVERLGVTVYERSPVTKIGVGRADTQWGRVDAPVVVRATEGFTPSLPRLRRRWLPMNSSMIVTEPMAQDIWFEIGWQGRETIGDNAHGFFYAQRTADDRIAIGGRAVPYRYGSRIDRDGKVDARTVRRLSATLRTVFPQTAGVGIAHGWCGVLGVPRDWNAGVGFDAATGLAWAGGYAGHGVTATNLAGRTLADLLLRHRSPLIELPWVNHTCRDWEPEPLRWLGVRAMYLAYRLADWHEEQGRATTSPIARLADRVARRPQPID
jgi:glycine/D-amino acid oxidase-like deaminating enzyme